MMRILLCLTFLTITSVLYSQSFDRIQPKVYESGVELRFPFAGGMNCPQVSQVDLNNDNKTQTLLNTTNNIAQGEFIKLKNSLNQKDKAIDELNNKIDFLLLIDFLFQQNLIHLVTLVDENMYVNKQLMYENDVQMFENRSYITMIKMMMDATNQ